MFFFQAGNDNQYNAWEEDIAVVNIFFGGETVMGGITIKNLALNFFKRSESDFFSFKLLLPSELERQIRMSPIEFLSSLGGLFGLCLGFSIASFFEIIYWFTIVLSRLLLKFFFSFYKFLMFRNVGRSVRK